METFYDSEARRIWEDSELFDADEEDGLHYTGCWEGRPVVFGYGIRGEVEWAEVYEVDE